MRSSEPVFLGIDVGTSGIRGSCIDMEGEEIATQQLGLELPKITGTRIEQDPAVWKQALFELIRTLSTQVKPLEIVALSIDGTSSTVLLCDPSGAPVSPSLMYNDQSSLAEAREIADRIPADSAALGATSSLAKSLQLLKQYPDARHICHQADWLAGNLMGRYDTSDANNCLKLGYDVINEHWPEWMTELDIPLDALPLVYSPGTVTGTLHEDHAQTLGLSEQCLVVAGTTDSIASFIATGAKETGDAVTSLGSTLVLKIIADKPVFAPQYGIYSHKLDDKWLAGGASNSGGRVLLQHFSQPQLDQMTHRLKPQQTTDLNYYPLPATGERFPRNDPELLPQLSPRPNSDLQFFQGMLEGIADIEVEGYQQLVNQGAPVPRRVLTTGRGSQNLPWNQIRQQKLKVPVAAAEKYQASYGAALLAKQGYMNTQ